MLSLHCESIVRNQPQVIRTHQEEQQCEGRRVQTNREDLCSGIFQCKWGLAVNFVGMCLHGGYRRAWYCVATFFSSSKLESTVNLAKFLMCSAVCVSIWDKTSEILRRGRTNFGS